MYPRRPVTCVGRSADWRRFGVAPDPRAKEHEHRVRRFGRKDFRKVQARGLGISEMLHADEDGTHSQKGMNRNCARAR